MGDYSSGAYEGIDEVKKLNAGVKSWRNLWHGPANQIPECKILPLRGLFVLVDTRPLPGVERNRVLDRGEAAFLLRRERFCDSSEQRLAIRQKLAVHLDGSFIPLAISDSDTLQDL